MKKLYIFATSLFLGGTALFNAQESIAANSIQSVTLAKPLGVIYSQESTGISGIVSDVLSNGNFVVAADDFTLTSAANVGKFNFVGFQNAQNLNTLVTGLIMYIYNDNAGKPEGIPNNSVTPVLKVDLASSSTAYTLTSPSTSAYLFTVDIVAATGNSLALQANKKYWVVFAPKVNLAAYTGTTRWNWHTGTTVGDKAKLVDPQNAFGANATNWTDISALTGDVSFDGLAFSIEDAVLSTGEVYSTIKNITVVEDANQLYVYAKNNKIKSIEIYSAEGRNIIKSTSEKVDVSSLKKGVYIVNILMLDGSKSSTKFIKK